MPASKTMWIVKNNFINTKNNCAKGKMQSGHSLPDCLDKPGVFWGLQAAKQTGNGISQYYVIGLSMQQNCSTAKD